MTDSEKINQTRLRNVWLGGHIGALQEVIKELDARIVTYPSYDNGDLDERAAALESLKDHVNSKLILAQDTQRRLRERS